MSQDRPFIRYVHTGPIPIYLGFTMCEKAWEKETSRLGFSGVPMLNKGSDGCTHMLSHPKSGRGCIVAIRPGKGTTLSEVIGLIAHEATHVWQAAMESINEKDPSSEFQAYTIQWFTQSLFDLYQQEKKPKKGAKK